MLGPHRITGGHFWRPGQRNAGGIEPRVARCRSELVDDVSEVLGREGLGPRDTLNSIAMGILTLYSRCDFLDIYGLWIVNILVIYMYIYIYM